MLILERLAVLLPIEKQFSSGNLIEITEYGEIGVDLRA